MDLNSWIFFLFRYSRACVQNDNFRSSAAVTILLKKGYVAARLKPLQQNKIIRSPLRTDKASRNINFSNSWIYSRILHSLTKSYTVVSNKKQELPILRENMGQPSLFGAIRGFLGAGVLLKEKTHENCSCTVILLQSYKHPLL